FFSLLRLASKALLCPYTTLFRSAAAYVEQAMKEAEKEERLAEQARDLEKESEHLMHRHHHFAESVAFIQVAIALSAIAALTRMRSEEHTSELQSPYDLVCRLLLE